MSVNHFEGRSATFKDEYLCQNCKSLGLSVDKFLIASSDLARSIGLRPTVAPSRDQTELTRIVAPSGLQLNSGLGQKSLGKLSDIRARSTEQGCSLCRLVWTAVERYSQQVVLNMEKNVTFSAGTESESTFGQGVDSGSEFERSDEKCKEPNVDTASDCFMGWDVDCRQARGRRIVTGEGEDTQYSNVSRRIRFWWKQWDGKGIHEYKCTNRRAWLTDDYGRKVRGLVRKDWPVFTYSMSDNPFGVKVVGLDVDRSHLSDQAILQFYTLRAQFYILPNNEATELLPPGDGLVRCDVADGNNDWCGHIVLNEDWARPRRGTKCHFIALSEAKSFTQDECRNWAHCIPRDQEDVEWDLYFVLLIEWKQKRLLWERVGLGTVFQVAFKVGGSEEQEEILLG